MYKVMNYRARSGRGMQMADNEINVHNRKGNYSIVFNRRVSGELRDGGFRYLELVQDDVTLDVGLRISKGTEFTENPVLLQVTPSNVTLQHKGIVQMLAGHFGETRPDFAVEVTPNISRRDDIYFLRLISITR